MKDRWIVITSIYPPRQIILNNLQIGYSVVVVGDKKTPHESWQDLTNQNFHYLTPEQQDFFFPEFSKTIGFNTYARKNLGYLFAIMNGATSIWDTDDDTYIRPGAIPQLNDLSLCTNFSVEGDGFFNPYNFFAPGSELWPRGYPLRLIHQDKISNSLTLQVAKSSLLPKIDILQTLVNLEPDLDAIFRMTVGDHMQDFDIDNRIIHLENGVWAPGNTQSTLWLNPNLFQYLYIPRWVSFRFCDILKMYIAQSRASLGYSGFWSEQIRNPHDYMIDFESEVSCYLNTEKVVALLREFQTDSLVDIYRALNKEEICLSQEIEASLIFEEQVKVLQNG
jgi:hypothetical protein